MNQPSFIKRLAEFGLTFNDGSVEPGVGYIFVTGSTGLVGQFLIKDLLLKNQKLALLVRAGRKQTAEQRIESIIQRWEQELGRLLPRPVVFQGDLQNEKLSLSDEQAAWVKDHCDRIVHNAAVLKFNATNTEDEPWTTNLHGTRHVLQFASDCQIEQLHYVSTAYVSGICEQVFSESDFDLGQEFRNDYEHSKFEAEKLVRAATGFASKTIYRPVVISGDSQTGYTPAYHGVYVYLRLMATMIPLEPQDENGVRHISIKLPMQGDEPRNLVPADWVSAVMTRIICDPSTHDKTYHLVPEEKITARKLVNFSYEYFNSMGTTFSDVESRASESEQGDFAKTYLDNVSIYSDYDKTDPQFDCENVKAVCGDLVCPTIDKEIIFKYYDFGIRDNWGKRKPAVPKFECWLERNLPPIEQAGKQFASDTQLPADQRIALNVVGPGGGQWTLLFAASGEFQIRPGIHGDFLCLLTIDSAKNADALVAEPELWPKLFRVFADFGDTTQQSAS